MLTQQDIEKAAIKKYPINTQAIGDFNYPQRRAFIEGFNACLSQLQQEGMRELKPKLEKVVLFKGELSVIECLNKQQEICDMLNVDILEQPLIVEKIGSHYQISYMLLDDKWIIYNSTLSPLPPKQI